MMCLTSRVDLAVAIEIAMKRLVDCLPHKVVGRYNTLTFQVQIPDAEHQ